MLTYFINNPTTTEIYTLSLHDALPISMSDAQNQVTTIFYDDSFQVRRVVDPLGRFVDTSQDRKSIRLNSSHVRISYAVFCLKKKINQQEHNQRYAYLYIVATATDRSNV